MTSKAAFNRGTLDQSGTHRSRDDNNGRTVDESPVSFQRRPPSMESNYSNSAQKSGGADDSWRRSGSSSNWDKGTDRFRGNRSGYERENGNLNMNYSRPPTRDVDAASERPRLTLIKRGTEDSTGKALHREENVDAVISIDKNTDKSLDDTQDKKEINQEIQNETQRDSSETRAPGKMNYSNDRNSRYELKMNSRAAFLGETSGSSRNSLNEVNMLSSRA